MLSRLNIQAINRTRALVGELERKTSEDDYGSGRFAEACRDAEEALVNVLIVARFFLNDPNVTEQVLRGEPHARSE